MIKYLLVMKMKECLLVGLGGGIGAILRYLLSTIPLKSDFPFMTLLINILGAILIGMVVSLSMKQNILSPDTVLFLKTGVCGGFTTFSTFSLESLTLLEQHKPVVAISYMILSLLLCLLGVFLGKSFIQTIKL